MCKEFEDALEENNGVTYKAILDLSIKYNMSERQVQNIVYTYRKEF